MRASTPPRGPRPGAHRPRRRAHRPRRPVIHRPPPGRRPLPRRRSSRSPRCSSSSRGPRSRHRPPGSPPRRPAHKRGTRPPLHPPGSRGAHSGTRACAPECFRTCPSSRTCRPHGTSSGWRIGPSVPTASGRGMCSPCDLPRKRRRGRSPTSAAPCTQGTAPCLLLAPSAPSSGSWAARRTTGRCNLRSRGASSETAWDRSRRRGPGRSCRQTPRSLACPRCRPAPADRIAPSPRRERCPSPPRPSWLRHSRKSS
mmetsp:Transcript_38738/g.114841  ORF Transcript_38738/g.114841 Transcript_38738/m.114841 type:complete len:255 (-) Transcript_38738:473-1237(-)